MSRYFCKEIYHFIFTCNFFQTEFVIFPKHKKQKTMKKVIVIIALLALPFYSMCINDPSVENAVRSEITYSPELKANNIQGEVLVQFTVLKDGYVKVDQINSSDVTLKEYVAYKLNAMFFGNNDEEKQYNMRFSFKIL